MTIITDIYESDGDLYWPDTIVGSKLDYGFKWSEWLTNENDDFVSMTWDELPTGLSSAFNADGINDAGEDFSVINIEADVSGAYCISGIMVSVENGHKQYLPVQINLIVGAVC